MNHIFLSAAVLIALASTDAAKATTATEPAACVRQRALTSELLGKSIPIDDAIRPLLQEKFILMGESHLEGVKGTRFYLDFLSKIFAKKENTCLFVEWDKKTFGPIIDACVTGKAPDEDGICEDLAASQDHTFAYLRELGRARGMENIFAVDDSEREFSGSTPGEKVVASHEHRNQFMAAEIARLSRAHRCQWSVFIGGASHLTGTDGKRRSLPTRLREQGIKNFKVVQVLLTGAGRWGESPAPMYDSRWHVNGDLRSCNPPMPVRASSWALKKVAGGSFIPTGLGDGAAEPFGSWNDFDFSIFIDGY